MSKTINDHLDEREDQFRKLSTSYKRRLRREAVVFMAKNPGCADHSGFWRGLSARQVVAAASK